MSPVINIVRNISNTDVANPGKDTKVVGQPDPLIVGSSLDVIGASDHILGKSLHPEGRHHPKS